MQTIEQRFVFQPRHPPAAFLVSSIEPQESLIAVAEAGGDDGEVVGWEVAVHGVLSQRVEYQPSLFMRPSARVDYGQHNGSDSLHVIIVRGARNYGFEESCGFVQPVVCDPGHDAPVERLGELRIHLKRFFALLDGGVETARAVKKLAGVRNNNYRKRIEPLRLAQFLESRVESVLRGVKIGQPLMRFGKVGVEFDGSQEFNLGLHEVPVVPEGERAERGVRFGKLVVVFERARDLHPRLRHELARRQLIDAQHQVAIGHSGVGQGVARVAADRLDEIFDAFLHSRQAALVPEIAAAQVKLIGLGIVGVMFGQPLPLFAVEFDLQVFGNLPRDLVFELEDVDGFSMILFGPQHRAVSDVNQLGLDHQTFATPQQAADEDRADVEFASDLKRVNVAFLVTEDSRAGHDTQSGQARKRVDDAFGNAVAQVFGGRVVAGVG